MKKGVNAWIYPSNFAVEKVLETSCELGYDGVELNLDEKNIEATKKERKAIADKALSLGLELPSLCSGLFWKYNLASPDEKVRKKGIDILKKGCEFSANIGAPVFLVVPAVAVPEVSYQKMWDMSMKGILEAAPVAKDCGVVLGIENVWNKFLYSPLEFRRFVEEINHPNVKVYFDVGNFQLLAFPQQWIKYLSDLIVCVHVKDFEMSTLQFKPLLQGDVPWPEVMRAFRDIGYTGFLNVEVPPYLGHPTKSAMDSKAALDIILQMA